MLQHQAADPSGKAAWFFQNPPIFPENFRMDSNKIRQAFLAEVRQCFPKVKVFHDIKRVPIKDLRLALSFVESQLQEHHGLAPADFRREMKDVYKMCGIRVRRNGDLEFKF